MIYLDIHDVLKKPYITSKSSFLSKKNNVYVFKVNMKSNKLQIYNSISKIFNVKIKKIRILLVKENKRDKIRKKNYISIWKKAYIFLKNRNNSLLINKKK